MSNQKTDTDTDAQPLDVPPPPTGSADMLRVKLSAMHDQYGACMGVHPERLLLTSDTASVLGWNVGQSTPYYAKIESITSSHDIFLPNAEVRHGGPDDTE